MDIVNIGGEKRNHPRTTKSFIASETGWGMRNFRNSVQFVKFVFLIFMYD